MKLAAPLNIFFSTLICKKILLKRLIIQGQRKEVQMLGRKNGQCFHFPLSTATLGSRSEHATWAAFDHHLVREFRNCTNFRRDFPT